MSILIKGMKMPERCDNCPFHVRNHGEGFYSCVITGHFPIPIGDTERSCECVLKELPPHGRLIDADALRKSIKESIDECHKWADEVEGGEMYARVSQSLGTFVECSLRVKAAPTIIEAEEET